VRDPKDWRWSGYGEALAGKLKALEGLQWVLFEDASMRMNEECAAREVADPQQVLREYRMALFFDGQEHLRDERLKRAGISRKRVEKVLAEGGRLSEGDILLCRTRYFVDGVAIGSERFINHLFTLMRESFGPGRKTGARRMRRVESPLCTLRDLQKDVLRC
jgi:putative transposase